jgi:hypothetical protein
MRRNVILVIAIALIALLAVIGGIIYYRYYYPYSGNAPAITQKEIECGVYYGSYAQKKPGTPDDWKWISAGRSSGWSVPGNTNSPIDCDQEPPLIGGCAGVSADNLQECCDRWEEESHMMRIQCVGAWAIKENKCAWECGGGDVE